MSTLSLSFFFFFFTILFAYLFLVVLGLGHCASLSLVAESGGYSLVAVPGFLNVVTSPVVEHRL